MQEVGASWAAEHPDFPEPEWINGRLADLPEVSYQVTIQVERTLRAWRPARQPPTEARLDGVRRPVD